MIVEIDEGSGFCFGVTTAIKKAEEELAKGNTLYCLGDIVHNGMECDRLKEMGLITIDHEEFKQLRDAMVLLRAHGEPPATYELARQNNITIVDATCPVVLALQKRIKKKYESMEEAEVETKASSEESTVPSAGTIDASSDNPVAAGKVSGGGSIVIFGKNGHAEVLGLVGQTAQKAIVIEHFEDVKKLDFDRDIYLYSQTTKSLDEFHSIISYIEEHISPEATFEWTDTICRQVANRMPNICSFATKHDVILFVSGRKSSNGKVLFNACKAHNAKTYLIEGPEEIRPEWFEGVNSVGICGATSTPKWLMEQCKLKIKK